MCTFSMTTESQGEMQCTPSCAISLSYVAIDACASMTATVLLRRGSSKGHQWRHSGGGGGGDGLDGGCCGDGSCGGGEAEEEIDGEDGGVEETDMILLCVCVLCAGRVATEM